MAHKYNLSTDVRGWCITFMLWLLSACSTPTVDVAPLGSNIGTPTNPTLSSPTAVVLPSMSISPTVEDSATAISHPTVTSTLLQPTATLDASLGSSTPASSNTPTAETSTSTGRPICLVVQNQDQEATVRQELEVALEQVRVRHPDWESVMGQENPIIEIGCEVQLPTEPLQRDSVVGPSYVDSPQRWHAVIIVLDESQATSLLIGTNSIVVPYQMMQIGEHESASVASALVIRAGTFGEMSSLQGLALALRLDPDRLNN